MNLIQVALMNLYTPVIGTFFPTVCSTNISDGTKLRDILFTVALERYVKPPLERHTLHLTEIICKPTLSQQTIRLEYLIRFLIFKSSYPYWEMERMKRYPIIAKVKIHKITKNEYCQRSENISSIIHSTLFLKFI